VLIKSFDYSITQFIPTKPFVYFNIDSLQITIMKSIQVKWLADFGNFGKTYFKSGMGFGKGGGEEVCFGGYDPCIGHVKGNM
jgi:hypothetical protein